MMKTGEVRMDEGSGARTVRASYSAAMREPARHSPPLYSLVTFSWWHRHGVTSSRDVANEVLGGVTARDCHAFASRRCCSMIACLYAEGADQGQPNAQVRPVPSTVHCCIHPGTR